VPSAIPPVDIPQEIRDRARSNGAAPEQSEGGVILTPPSGGGDVHGDPGVGGPGERPMPPGPASSTES
jgi:cell division protease FtsH